MPTPDGRIGARDICTGAAVERVISDGGVTSLKISATLQSDNFSSGSAGWQIRRDTGAAEFQDVVVRGTLNASDITSGTLNAAVVTVSNLDADNITSGTLSGSRLENGAVSSLKIASAIQSDNYSAGSAGWKIERDTGDAYFNDVTIRGTLSANTVNGWLTTTTGGGFRTATSGQRVEISDTSYAEVVMYSGGSSEDAPASFAIGSDGTLKMNGPQWSSNTDIGRVSIYSNGAIQLNAGANGYVTTDHLLSPVGSSAAPSYSFIGDTNTGMYRYGSNSIGLTVGGARRMSWDVTNVGWDFNSSTLLDVNEVQAASGDASDPSFTFNGDTDTGMYRFGADQIGFACGGSNKVMLSASSFYAGAIYSNQAGSSANVYVASTGLVTRLTSALKYKTAVRDMPRLADIVLRPVEYTSIKHGSHHYGFIADDISGQLADAGIYGDDGDVEDFDTRAVIAILAAKVNRLEGAGHGH